MAFSSEKDQISVSGSHKELLKEDVSERSMVNTLLELSDEAFLRELEPYEDDCFCGWDEAVRGWSRLSPLSGIFLPLKKERKAKSEDNPLSVDPTPYNADTSISSAESRGDVHTDNHDSFKKTPSLTPRAGSGYQIAEALQAEEPEWSTITAMQNLQLDEGEDGPFRATPHRRPPNSNGSKSSKPRRHSHRAKSKLVPIKNFIFLPPIKASQKAKSGSGRCSSEEPVQPGYMLDRKGGSRAYRVSSVPDSEIPIYTAAMTSKYQVAPNNFYLFSASSTPRSKKYHVPMWQARPTAPPLQQCRRPTNPYAS